MERAAFLIQDPQLRSAPTRLSCLLNPNTLVFRRVAGLHRRRSLAGAVTQEGLRDDPLVHTGGGFTELRLDLLFDVNIPGTWLGAKPEDPKAAEEDERDVRDLTRPLWNLAENHKRPGAVAGPPRVSFVWGKRWDFSAMVAAVAERLESFTPSGVPQRSFLRLRLLRAHDDTAPEEVPASGLSGMAAPPEPAPASPLDVLPLAEQLPAETYESYVSPGYPMFLTAFFLFGDASRWSVLAEENPDIDPVFVPPGTVLRVPTRGRLVAP
ncbi:MAG TPA: hypothetical protein VNO30_27905 [Kofleriaceae bacterium]|nr:hypothetical protein [Kofleriaceae bacterium]